MNFITSKRWLLLLAATAATLGIAGCGSDGGGTVGATYAVTVESAGANPAGAGNYSAGVTVSIKAGTPPTADQKFGYWTTSSDGVNFAHADSATTTFTMPTNDVTVTANFVLINDNTKYAVTVESAGANPMGAGNYSAGETVAIQAGTPPTGQKFSGWTATPAVNFARADSAVTTFNMPPNAVTVKANFVPVGGGTTEYAVKVSGLGTNSTGAGNYLSGDTVSIYAGTPPADQQFKNWTTGDGVDFDRADSAATWFVMPAKAVTVTAVFEPIGGDSTLLYTVQVQCNPQEGGSVNISGMTDVSAGTQIPITATANEGYAFRRWMMMPSSGTFADANSASTIFTVNGPVTLTAEFTEIAPATYSVITRRSNNRHGTIFVNGIENPIGANARFDTNAEMTVSASPASGYKFVNWTSGALPSGADATKDTIKFTLTDNVDIQANFAESGNEGAGAIFYEGRTYKTVKITGGKTWMAENLNYQPDNTGTSWCYENKPSNCTEYGRLYDWNTAKDVCPSGWELPSRSDWGNLAKAAGGNGPYGETGSGAANLKSSSSGWKSSPGIMSATNQFYFSGLPGGGYYPDSEKFLGGGDELESGMWWTATQSSSVSAYSRSLAYDIDNIEEYPNNKADGFSVRCVSMD